MKSIKVTLPNKSDIRIIPFADLHLGSSKCNMDLILSQIEKVKNDENTFAILVGDLINNSTKTSVGDVFTEMLNPMEQMTYAVDRANCKVNEREQTFVNCASTLDYEGYAELYGMRPSSTAQPEIILGGHQKSVKVII